MPGAAHALYPGTFDILTNGHLDILRRAARIFGKVTVAIAVNPSKPQTLFTTGERLDMLREATKTFGNVAVESFSCLTVEFARQIGADCIVRGLRAISDFEYELQMAMANDTLAPEVTTLFMAPSPQHSFLSSSMVREIARFGGNISDFVPHVVEVQLKERLRSKP